jgi:Uma2 family endonuclease
MHGEIVLPVTEPETEWVRNRPLQKVSPKRDHSRVQGELGALLTAWSRGRGEVGPEWRFRIAVSGEPRRPLVPDLAFVALERLRGLTHEEIQAPAFAPTIAVEILSPGDDPLDVASKVDVYLRGGSTLVIVVDPKQRTFSLYDAIDTTTFAADDTVRHGALPDFALPVRPFFAAALGLPM